MASLLQAACVGQDEKCGYASMGLSTCCCPTCVTMQGFDEYMNLVLEEAEEVSMKKGSRKQLGMVCSNKAFACTIDLQTPIVLHLLCSISWP